MRTILNIDSDSNSEADEDYVPDAKELKIL